MDNECNDPMIDWILQLDSVPYANSADGYLNPTSQQQNEVPAAYTTSQYTSLSQTSLPLTTPFPTTFESPNHASTTDCSNSSGTDSITTKAELFQLYEEEEEPVVDLKQSQQHQQLIHEHQQQYHQYQRQHPMMDTAQSHKAIKSSAKIGKPTDRMYAKQTKRTKSKSASLSNPQSSLHGAEPLSGRLDFRPTMTDQVPENQLKTMSPRERRQLRNKISARNFRNRRKEYMTTLEEELDTCKSENKKLHTKLATLQDKMNKLEDENKQLRLDLVLYRQGIHPAPKHGHQQPNIYNNINSSSINSTLPHNSQQQHPPNNNDIMTSTLSFESSPGTLHALSSGSSASPPDMNMLHDFPQITTQQQQQYHYQQQQQEQLQLMRQHHPQQQYPPEMASAWNLPLPPDFNLHNMYLSHATMPEWDVSRVLSKAIEYSLSPPLNNISVTDTFQRFPLLAPALMSIVVGHTMTLSPKELMTLTKSSSNTIDSGHIKGKRLGVYPTRSGFDDKRALKIWQLLQPLTRRKPANAPPEETIDPEDKRNGKKKAKMEDDGDDDKEDKKDDSLKTTLASYAAYFEGKCVVTAYVLGQMSILHGLASDDTPTSTKVNSSRLSEIEDSSDDDDDDDNEENDDDSDDNDEDEDQFDPDQIPSSSRPSEILPLCNQFKRSKDMYIPVS